MDDPRISCRRCGFPPGPGGHVAMVLVLAYKERALGSLRLTHHEVTCGSCRERNVWHVRTRTLLGMVASSTVPCTCKGEAGRSLSPSVANSVS